LGAPPGVERYLIERHDPCGPYGMKGVREFSFFPAALAFNSAIRQATQGCFDKISLLAEFVSEKLSESNRK
jgi:CO/xanthine dehydrogenase Mo-binding subunit